MIRLLVIDESTPTRRWVATLVDGDPEIVVANQARSCDYGAVLSGSAPPDVIVVSLDAWLAATPAIQGQLRGVPPRPTIILSVRGDRRADAVTRNPFSGFVRVLEKPDATISSNSWQRSFLNAIRAASGTSVVRHVASAPLPHALTRTSRRPIDLVVMGASAGGPRTVGQLLAALPPLPVPLLLVMHFPANMYDNLVDWLGSMSTMPLVRAAEGQPLRSLAGMVTIALPTRHMTVVGGVIALNDGPRVNYCKPAVDPLFEAAAAACGRTTLGVLLTGMGCDGAAGLLKIRQAGGITIAQDEATSEIWGMPRAAIERGAAEHILGDHEMPAAIATLCGSAACTSDSR